MLPQNWGSGSPPRQRPQNAPGKYPPIVLTMKLPKIAVEVINREACAVLKEDGKAIARPDLNRVLQIGAWHARLLWPLLYLKAKTGAIGQIHQKQYLEGEFSLGQGFCPQQ